jgi:small subunit ribosomal protein S1
MFTKVVVLSLGLSASAFTGISTPNAYKRASTEVSMVATAAVSGKNLSLRKIKERYSGRGDLGSSDNAADLENYDLFAAADLEELDPPKTGNMITGMVIEIDENGALLEIGGKMSGYLPVKEAALIPIKNVNEVLSIGQEVTAEVIGTLKGMPVMSLRSRDLGIAWEKILVMRSADTAFDAVVEEVNKGGAVLNVLGLKAFLPGSHYLGTPDASLIGTTLKVKFLDLNEEEGKVVVSQRRALMDTQAMDMKRGDVLAGTITGIRPYGAFLELDGGVAGLLHISQISYDRIDNLETLFTVGQRAKVMILDHDKQNGRVALSTKTLEPSPGDMLRNMEAVFSQAEETAKRYHERMDAERKAREAAAKDIVAGLGGAMEGEGSDPLLAVAESIESILASIVSDAPEGKTA